MKSADKRMGKSDMSLRIVSGAQQEVTPKLLVSAIINYFAAFMEARLQVLCINAVASYSPHK